MWIVALVVVIVLVLAIVAYVATQPTGPPAPPTVLVVGTTEVEETLDPADAYNYFSVNMLQNTMATLLTYSESGDGTLAPNLLTEVPSDANGGITPNGLTYTLHLRQDAEFEDGTPINASVVKFSIDRSVKAMFDPAANQDRLAVPSFLLDPIEGANAYFTAFTGLIDDPANHTQAEVDAAWANYVASGVEVVDEWTVEIHMGRVWSPMVQLLAFTSMTPVNPNAFTQDAFKPAATDISASGPFRVAAFVPGERAELVRNPTWFGTPAQMEKVVIRFYQTGSALALALESGEIDVAYRNLDPQDFNRLAGDARFRAESGSSPVIRYLVFKANSAPFDDPDLRRALAYAVDRGPIVETVFLNSTAPLYSLVPEGMFGHKDVFLTQYPRNVATARTMIEAAGFSAANPLTFNLWYTPSRYGTTEADVAQLIKQAWEETGVVQVTLQNQEWGTYRQSFRQGLFNVFLLGWFPDYLDPDNYVFPFLHCGSGGTASFGSWYCNNPLDAQIELQARQTDPAQREQTLFGIQDTLAADVPYIPLWQTTQQIVYKPSVTGIVLDDSQLFRYYTLKIT